MAYVAPGMGINVYVPSPDNPNTTVDDAAARAAAAATNRGDNTTAQARDAQAEEMRRAEAIKNGQTGDTQKTTTTTTPTKSWEQIQAEAADAQRKALTRDAVKAAFGQYGLSALYPLIEQWAQLGLTEDAIYLQLRGTQEYKNRFPAMEGLAAKGRALSESQYVQYETQVAQIEQQYGFPKGMMTGQITDMLLNDLSTVEVQDRAILAAADSLTAPDDLRQQLKDYYGVDPDEALKAYYLDPEIALPLLQKQSAAARIGVQATRQGLQGVGKDLAEELQGIGVSEDQAKQGFATTAYQKGFGTSRGESADQNTRIDAILKGDAEAITTVERVKQGRVNRFEGGGAYVGSASGVSALGGSGT
jgi:hypothetical protein